MSRIKDENFYQISGWMLNRLGLKGTELQVFAIIYGFSQDGETVFSGSLNYLSDWLGTSRPTTIKALKGLTDKGLIVKETLQMNGVTFNRYKANLETCFSNFMGGKETLLPVKNIDGGSKETLPQGSKETLLGGSKETLPNNKSLDNKSLDNNNIYKKEVPTSAKVDTSKDTKNDTKIIAQKHKYGEFNNVLLSDDEFKKLQDKFIDWQSRIDELSYYLESKGAKYKSHYATILNWSRKNQPKLPKKEDSYGKLGTWV